MVKRAFIIVLIYCFLGCLGAKAQTTIYGNEWIVPGQPYFKIPTAQNGMYALTFSQLSLAGVNMSVNPQAYQLWHRGVEQKILVKGEADGVFNNGDSLIFYGQKNDGTMDAPTYIPASNQPHNYYNLYSDTTAYFLTYNPSNTTNLRMAMDLTNTVQPSQPYHMAQYLNVFSDNYSMGADHNTEAHESYGDVGETWCSNTLDGSSLYSTSIQLTNVVNNAGSNFTVEVMLVGMNDTYNRTISISIGGLTSGNVGGNFPTFQQFSPSTFVGSYSASMLNSGTTTISISIDASATALNSYAIAYIKITYPQAIAMTGTSTLFTPSPTSSTPPNNYYSINWTPPSPALAAVYDVSDKNNPGILNTTQAGNTLGVFVPTSVTSFIVTPSNAYMVPSITNALFDLTILDTVQDYLIIYPEKLNKGFNGSPPACSNYAAHRESPAGGSHAVLMVEVHNIFNMFGYGEFNPTAIKNFCLYQADHNSKVKNLLLIGKGIVLDYGSRIGSVYYRQDPSFYINSTNPAVQIENFIPPFGSPPSDIYYGLRNHYSGGNLYFTPTMAVGRISAKTESEVNAYYEKILAFEELDSNLLWRKQLVHISGGADTGQISTFASYVAGYKAIAESPLFDGDVVKTFQKDLNAGAIDNINISDYVNAGLNMVTYFGHSAYFVTEVNIGDPSQPIYGYNNGPNSSTNNQARYPMMILNGCESAAVYYTSSTAEDWTLTPNLGAIAVLGVCDIGYTYPLNNYCSAMYTGMYNTASLVGQAAGTVMKWVLTPHNFDTQTTLQMNFHGDPAVRMYSPSKTDYEISGDKDTRVDVPNLKCFLKSFNGSKVTAATDSFMVGIPVKNFGINADTVTVIQVSRTVNGVTTNYPDITYSPVKFIDTLYFTIRGNGASFYGPNQINITINPNDIVKEMRYDNNTAEIDYFMSLSGVTCLFPVQYSIVHSQPITFVAQSTDLLVSQRDYYIELDTDYKFNTGFKKSTVVTSGSLIKWTNVDLLTDNNKDSIVYYWRVRFNTFAAGEDTAWANSSFIYIKNSPDGWSQSEAPQFTSGDLLQSINMNLSDSVWQFGSSALTINANVFGNSYRQLSTDSSYIDYTSISVGGNRTIFPGFQYTACAGTPANVPAGVTNANYTFKLNGILAYHIIVERNSFQLAPGYCGVWPNQVIFNFANGSGLDAWLNAIPSGDYILLASDGNADFDSWPQPLKDKLQFGFGAKLMGQVHNNEPYILLARKGGSAPIAEKYSNNPSAVLNLDTTITNQNSSGTIVSTRIGPATQWGTFYQRIYASGADQYTFKVIRETLAGVDDTLSTPLVFAKNKEGIDTLDLSTLINAKNYPYIKLMVNVSDTSVLRTPPQLNRWQVIYHTVPEGTMDPFTAGLSNYTIANQSQGAKVCIPYVFENISNLSFGDSLFVKITAQGAGSLVKDTMFVVYKDSLKVGQSFNFTYCLNTASIYGNITLTTFVNPNIQPEQYYSNNIIQTFFQVTQDLIPPVIDVTFDGIHIMNGDIVSPSPLINITLNDNSKYLIINNPNDISIFFQSPGSSQVQILPSNPDIIRFGQTPGSTNTYNVEFNPKNLPDGEYTITVQGKDVNGNKSGQYYTIMFTVENASTITNFYPYPNPFSSSTRFVFTLTGAYIPDDLRIQIITVTGKVVREITKEELGNIHIGNNISDYAWNGTDQFGDKLANGVYLYRVVIKDQGDNFQHRQTAGDKAFKKDYGKLYILR
jgi:hypothetical protein